MGRRGASRQLSMSNSCLGLNVGGGRDPLDDYDQILQGMHTASQPSGFFPWDHAGPGASSSLDGVSMRVRSRANSMSVLSGEARRARVRGRVAAAPLHN